MGFDLRALLRVKDRRVRIVISLALFAVIALALYQLGTGLWAAHLHRRAIEALDRYEFADAGVLLDRYLALRPTDAATQLLAAQTARRRDDYEAAARYLVLARKHGVARDALNVEERLFNIQAGDVAAADVMVAFCAKDPASAESELALEAIIQGSLRALQLPPARFAIDLWLKGRTGKIDQARGLLWRARLHDIHDNFAEALADCRTAVDRAPTYLPARLRVAEAQLREDPRRATPDIDWLKQNASRDPSARLLIGRHHRRLSRPEEAARVLDELLDGDPNHVPALVERARVAMDLNQASAAERWLERALDLDAQNRDVNVAMADCLRLLSRIEEAERFQKRAKEIEDRLQKQLDDMRKDKGKEQGTKAVT